MENRGNKSEETVQADTSNEAPTTVITKMRNDRGRFRLESSMIRPNHDWNWRRRAVVTLALSR